MSGIDFTSASFNAAYRAFPVEQGHDAALAAQAADTVAAQNEGVAALTDADAGAALFISPAAARLYAEQVEAERRVQATLAQRRGRETSGSTTPDEGALPADTPHQRPV